MSKMIRRSVVAAAALLAICTFPVVAQTSNQAGLDNWPVSFRIGHR